jgi:hypothetical protein
MIDNLVWELNQLGYQPAWLPQTGLVPPDVYNLAEIGGKRRLVRRGPLRDYLPAEATAKLVPVRGRTVDIEHHRTTNKKLSGTTEFLRRALSCLGVVSIPKLDLGFVGGSELTISFADVEFVRVDVSAIEPLLPHMQVHAIPDDVIERGRLHVAYEYLYAGSVLVARADQRAFDGDLEAKLPELIDVRDAAHVSVERGTRLVFAAKRERAAFAYKAARLRRPDTRWEIDLSAATRGAETAAPYLPAEPGVVFEVEDADAPVTRA